MQKEIRDKRKLELLRYFRSSRYVRPLVLSVSSHSIVHWYGADAVEISDASLNVGGCPSVIVSGVRTMYSLFRGAASG